jgi:hypothetical protein
MKPLAARRSIHAMVPALALAFPGAAFADDMAACDLLTLGDVKSVLGPDWKRNETFSEGETCAYQGDPTAVVTIILTSDTSGAAAILAGRQKLVGDKAKPAAGPGTGAYQVTTPRTIALAFGKGNFVAQLEATPAATTDFAVLGRLAAQAYRRLP